MPMLSVTSVGGTHLASRYVDEMDLIGRVVEAASGSLSAPVSNCMCFRLVVAASPQCNPQENSFFNDAATTVVVVRRPGIFGNFCSGVFVAQGSEGSVVSWGSSPDCDRKEEADELRSLESWRLVSDTWQLQL